MSQTTVGGSQIKDGSLTDADIAPANVDGVAGAPSMRTLGTGAQQACAGNDSRLSSGGSPVGAALTAANFWLGNGSNIAAAVAMSGDGTLSNAGALAIANLAITDSKVAAANKDGVAATYSLRTLGTGAQQAAPGNDTRFRPNVNMRYTYSVTTTDADPGSGILRFNSTTVGSITTLYINTTDYSGIDVTTILTNLCFLGTINGSNGYLKVFNYDNPGIFWMFTIGTAVTTATGYKKIPLVYSFGNGTISTTAGNVGIEIIPFASHNHNTLYVQNSTNTGTLLGRFSAGSPGPYEQINVGDGFLIDAFGNLYNKINAGNLLINGGGDIWQRQAPATLTTRADKAFAADHWYVLTQTASISVQRIIGDKTLYAHRMSQSQATAQRMGYAQWVESRDCYSLQGRATSFQGKVRISNSQAIRVAIFGYVGGAVEGFPLDVVNSWTNTTYTEGNFFTTGSGSFVVIAVNAFTPAANTWTNFSYAYGTMPNCYNYGVMIWTERTAAQNVTLDMAELQLLPDSSSNGGASQLKSWTPRPFQHELAMCQRFFEKNTDWDIAAADGAVVDSNLAMAYDTSNLQSIYPFRVPKIKAGTGTPFKSSLGTGAGLYAYLNASTVWVDGTGITLFPSQYVLRALFAKTGAPFTYGLGYSIQGVWSVDAEIGV